MAGRSDEIGKFGANWAKLKLGKMKFRTTMDSMGGQFLVKFVVICGRGISDQRGYLDLNCLVT